jgi:hypothetical protein
MIFSRTFEHNGRRLRLSSDETELIAESHVDVEDETAAMSSENEICSLSLSHSQIETGESITLSAQISGKNIAFIYMELFFHDIETDQYFGPILQEHVLSDSSNQIQGVTYPIWGEDFNLELEITPVLRVLTDGINAAFACMVPSGYGNQDYQVDGFYTKGESNISYRSRYHLNSLGDLTNMLIFKDQKGLSIPRALVMEPGDQFSLFVQVLKPAADESQKWQVSRCISPGLIYSGKPFQWLTEAPLQADYLLGLVIEDFDGERICRYAPFTLFNKQLENLEIEQESEQVYPPQESIFPE